MTVNEFIQKHILSEVYVSYYVSDAKGMSHLNTIFKTTSNEKPQRLAMRCIFIVFLKETLRGLVAH